MPENITVAWMVNEEGVLTDITDTIEALVGYTPEELLSQNGQILLSVSPKLVEVQQQLIKAIRGSDRIHSYLYESVLVHKKGYPVQTQNTVVVLSKSDQKFAVGVARPRCEVRALWDRLSDESRHLFWRIGQRLAELDESFAV